MLFVSNIWTVHLREWAVLFILGEMIDEIHQLNNTSFALLVWYVQEGKDDEAKVYSGAATWNPDTECVEVRRNDDGEPVLVLSGAQLNRINKVTEDVKHILLDCDYGISLSMSDLPEHSRDEFALTGLKWGS